MNPHQISMILKKELQVCINAISKLISIKRKGLNLKISQNKCTFKKENGNIYCYFGLPNIYQKYEPLTSIPEKIKSLNIFDSDNATEIIKILFEKGVNENLEELTIGYVNAEDAYGENSDNLPNYCEITELLSTFSFPKLKIFNFGKEKLYVNKSAYTGYLGNLTKLLQSFPVIESISLEGSFELNNSLELKSLTHINIYIVADYIEMVFLNKNLSFFLNSKFGRVKYFCLNVDGCDYVNDYLHKQFNNCKLEYFDLSIYYEKGEIRSEIFKIPNNFYKQLNNFKLEHFEISGRFEKGTKLQLEKYLANQKIDKKQIEIEEK